jgi:hypothetical protein
MNFWRMVIGILFPFFLIVEGLSSSYVYSSLMQWSTNTWHCFYTYPNYFSQCSENDGFTIWGSTKQNNRREWLNSVTSFQIALHKSVQFFCTSIQFFLLWYVRIWHLITCLFQLCWDIASTTTSEIYASTLLRVSADYFCNVFSFKFSLLHSSI